VLGTLLYYARAIDSTLLPALSDLSTEQANGTRKTLFKFNQLLDYCHTNPEATVHFLASGMQVTIESNASYLSVSKAKSRAAGYFYLSTRSQPITNVAIHVYCHIMREVVSSAAEAELGALFHSSKEACPLRIALEELGHLQSPTSLITDNPTASGIANDTVKQHQSKAIDVRFYWIRDRICQGQFTVEWKKGERNLADYFMKHHPKRNHVQIRSMYLFNPSNPNRNYFECLSDDDLKDQT
jgi:hypothetical protein